MNSEPITINVIIYADVYYKFYIFEKFFRTKGLLKIVFFACFLGAIGILSLTRDATFLGIVLLIIGLGLPIANIWGFFNAIKMQIKAFKLENPTPVYSLSFSNSPDGIEITNHGGGDEPLYYEWNNIHGVYRVDGCIYFYVLPNKAFLLPDNQASVSTDKLWQLFVNLLPANKLHDKRKK